MSVTTAASADAAIAQTVSRDAWVMRARHRRCWSRWLLLSIALPLWALLSKSFQNQNGEFVGLANYIRYFSTPSLFDSIFNSVWVAVVTTVIVIPLAFVYAYALTRSRMPFKGLFYAAAHAAAVRALAAVGDLADLPVRQPGPAQGRDAAAARSTARTASSWRRCSTASRMR